MPLLHDGSDESRSKNIATLIEEGKPEKQAVAIAYSIQRRACSEEDPEEVGKDDTGPIEEENRLIRKNMQMPQAHGRHDFKPAKWTAGNGHPRCLVCGDEEPEGGVCMGIHGAIPTNGDSTAHLAKAEPSEAQKRAGYEFFAGSALPHHQHRRARIFEARDDSQDVLNFGSIADDAV